MKLDPETLKVDSFAPDPAPLARAIPAQQAALAGSVDRYCTLIGTCNGSCWGTYCNCV